MKYKFDKNFEGIVCEPSNAEECFQMIIDLGFDYDGFNDSKNLQFLIDELVEYAKNGLQFLFDRKYTKENTEKKDYESLKFSRIKQERYMKNESLRSSSLQ